MLLVQARHTSVMMSADIVTSYPLREEKVAFLKQRFVIVCVRVCMCECKCWYPESPEEGTELQGSVSFPAWLLGTQYSARAVMGALNCRAVSPGSKMMF